MISAVADHLVQSTLIAAAAWMLSLALRSNSARVRHGVWLAASAKFLLPFAALVAIGGQFGWRAAPAPVSPEIRVVVTRTGALPAEHDSLFSLAAPPPPSSDFHEARAALPSGAAPSYRRFWPVLIAIWISGLLALLAVWAMQWRSVAAVVRAASPLESGRELTMLRGLEATRGIKRPLAVLATDEGVEPGVF